MLRPNIYLMSGKSDMRRGIDGLEALVIETNRNDLFKFDTMFIFCGVKKDRYKILC